MRFYEFKPIIYEAGFTAKRFPQGVVPFRSSKENDTFIQNFVNDLSKRTGVPVDGLLKKIRLGMGHLSELQKYSPLLYTTMLKNSAESAAFDLIFTSMVEVELSDYKFNEEIFRNLIKAIMVENSLWFYQGLRVPGEHKRKRGEDITPVIVPSKYSKYAAFNNIATACCTANGDFIFSRPFMEKLLYYGAVVDVQPSGPKYVANGGTIPNNYCYIETLFMHEVMHYTHGDFKKMSEKFSDTDINWATDLRSNYMLTKSGYIQLPIGLYSDDLNYDRDLTPNLDKLLQVVHDELQKLPGNLKQEVESEMVHKDHQKNNTSDQSKPSQDNNQPQEKPKLKPGQIVWNKHDKEYYKVKKNDNGNVTLVPADPEEVEMAKKRK